MLIQLPILFALYRVMQNIPAYVSSVKNLFVQMLTGADNLIGNADFLAKAVKCRALVYIRCGYLDFIGHYFPERGSFPQIPSLDTNIINLFKSYTEETRNHSIHYDHIRYNASNMQRLPSNTINFDNNNIILTILYIWDYNGTMN